MPQAILDSFPTSETRHSQETVTTPLKRIPQKRGLPSSALIGHKFNMLTVIGVSKAKSPSNRYLLECLCDCGRKAIVQRNNIPRQKSCGCLAGTPASELIGQKFNMLTVLSILERKTKDGQPYLLCRCDCGNTAEIVKSNVYRQKSCGCLLKTNAIERNKSRTIHGMSRGTTYHTWHLMMRRCHDPENVAYPGYGGKGIQVCPEWHKFENFYRDMGDRPEGRVLGRFDDTKDFCKANCRWATHEEQVASRRAARLRDTM